jgi:hypothetical protein
MSHTPTIHPVKREVIENKLLACLEQEGTVAVLMSEQDLADILCAFNLAMNAPHVSCYTAGIQPAYFERIESMKADYTKLQEAAFR